MMQLVWLWLQSEGTGSLEIFHLWLEMEGTLELLRNADCLMRKDKIWCSRWFGEYIIAGGNYAALRPQVGRKTAIFCILACNARFSRSAGLSLKRTTSIETTWQWATCFFFFLFLFVPGNGNCSFLLTRFTYSLERIVRVKRTNRWN